MRVIRAIEASLRAARSCDRWGRLSACSGVTRFLAAAARRLEGDSRAQIDQAQWLPNPESRPGRRSALRQTPARSPVCARSGAAGPVYGRDGYDLSRQLSGVLFCPLPDDTRYFNFEFNPNGALIWVWARPTTVGRSSCSTRIRFFASNGQTGRRLGHRGFKFRLRYQLCCAGITVRPGLRLAGISISARRNALSALSFLDRIHSDTPSFTAPRLWLAGFLGVFDV